MRQINSIRVQHVYKLGMDTSICVLTTNSILRCFYGNGILFYFISDLFVIYMCIYMCKIVILVNMWVTRDAGSLHIVVRSSICSNVHFDEKLHVYEHEGFLKYVLYNMCVFSLRLYNHVCSLSLLNHKLSP